MNGFVVIDVGMCPILFLHRWVVSVQFLGHSPDFVLLGLANLDADVIANVANGDAGLDGYVHAITMLDVVDLDVDHFATFDNVLLVVDFATLLDVVVLVVVVVDVLHTFPPFDVLNPLCPFDVWNPLHPFDAVDVHFGANLLVWLFSMFLLLFSM